MPHVIVKLLSGRSEQQKAKIAAEVTKAIMTTANCAEDAVSVCIEDVASNDWTEKVSIRTSSGTQAGSTKSPDTTPGSNKNVARHAGRAAYNQRGADHGGNA
jgi:4-oxalocrotonate tautomerase